MSALASETRERQTVAGEPCRERLLATAKHLSQALRFDPESAEVWHALGSVLARLGDRTGAVRALCNSLRLDASRANTQLALGNLLFDCGQFDQALDCFASIALAGVDR